MTAKEYVAKFNKATDKELFLKESIINNYVPHSAKIFDCETIVKASSNDNDVYKINSPAQNIIFVITVISKYTNIEIGDSVVDTYEELDKNNLIDNLLDLIPEKEIKTYKELLKMCNSDYKENNRNIVSFLENLFLSLNIAGEPLIKALEESVK